MDEIFEFADRVTILKDGSRRGTEEINELDRVKLIKLTYSYILSREELKHDNEELFYYKKYNENIIKNLPVGVIILDEKKNIYLINYSAINILELQNKDIAKKNIDIIINNTLLKKSDEILKNIEVRKYHVWHEVQFKKNKVLKITTYPYKDADYTILGTIILIEDISNDININDYLLRVERVSSIAELAAGVAHEINNPLGIIKNYLELLKFKENDNDGITKLSKITKELIRIEKIVNSLLTFSKHEELIFQKINLIDLVNEVLILLDHKIKEKNIILEFSYKKNDITLEGNENKLKQVFFNLLINSVDAVLDEGIIEIKVKKYSKQGYVEIIIADNGYGIPDNILKNIFNPFFSTKVNKKNTGLGLAICQHIIESHLGIISCKNKDKTIFNIRLPIKHS